MTFADSVYSGADGQLCNIMILRRSSEHVTYRGPPHQLDRFVQTYAVEKTRLEARRRGHTVAEQSLADGSIKLTVQVGGAV